MRIVAFLLLVLLCVPPPSPAQAAVQYVYDALGRLLAVVDAQGEAAVYVYDAVGNLLAIERSTVTAAAPQLTQVSPASVPVGATTRVTLTGQHLLVTRSLTTDHAGVSAALVSVGPTQVVADLTVAPGAALGAATATVTTPYGSAGIGLTVAPAAVVLTAVTPGTGEAGTTVTLDGTGLAAAGTTTTVTFEGPGGARVATPLLEAATPTRLIAAVPAGSVPGPVQVAVGASTSNGVTFTVLGPRVSEIFPPNAATGVAPRAAVTVFFSNAVDPATVTAATFTVSDGGTPVAGTVAATTASATFTPAAPMALNRQHTVALTAGVLNAQGLALTAFASQFTTDSTAPSATLTFTGIATTAATGTPADAARASANAGQTVIVNGTGLVAGVSLETARMTAAGLPMATPAAYAVTNINAEGTQGQATLGASGFFSTTGLTRLRGAGGPSAESVVLQVVPQLTTVSVPLLLPGRIMSLTGSGVTSTTKVRFPLATGETIVQPIVPGSVAYGANGQVVVPSGVGGGPLALVTAGGASAPLTLPGLTRLENPDGTLARASTGAPADAGQASVNDGISQVLVVRGTGLTGALKLRLPTAQYGLPTSYVDFGLASVSGDGTRAEATVLVLGGNSLVTGPARVVNPATGAVSTPVLLQAVPRFVSITLSGAAFAPGNTITVNGTSFTADARIRFPLALGGTLDQPVLSNSVHPQGISANVVIPAGLGAGPMTVVTPGGASAALTIPGITSLENPNGTLLLAQLGTPADAAQASTNGDQLVVVRGSGLTSALRLRVPIDNFGSPSFWELVLANITGGTRAEVTIPSAGFNQRLKTGQIRLVDTVTGLQSPQAPLLQAVPRFTSLSVPSYAPGQTMSLSGQVFTPTMTVRFPAAGGGSIDQAVVAGSVNNNGNFGQVVVPAGVASGSLTLITAGGQSNALASP